jgi:hypothetical protein
MAEKMMKIDPQLRDHVREFIDAKDFNEQERTDFVWTLLWEASRLWDELVEERSKVVDGFDRMAHASIVNFTDWGQNERRSERLKDLAQG